MNDVSPADSGALTRSFHGPATEWHSMGWPSTREGAVHHIASRELVSAPSADAFGGLPVAGEMYRAASRMLHAAALMPGCDALELRYVVAPSERGRGRIRTIVSVRSTDGSPEVARTVVDAACTALPAGFVTAAPADDPVHPGQSDDGTVVVELRRVEQVLHPEWDFIPASFYYTVDGEPGDGSGWSAFWRSLDELDHPVVVSVLFARTEIDPSEGAVLGAVLSDLGVLAEAHSESDFFGNSQFFPACANARVARDSWRERQRGLGRSPLLVRLAVRAAPAVAVRIGQVLAAAVSAQHEGPDAYPMGLESPRDPVDRARAVLGFDGLEIIPWGGHPLWQDDEAPHTLRRFPYLFGVAAAAGLMALPVPGATGVPGVPRSRRIVHRAEEVLDDATEGAALHLGHRLHLGRESSPFDLPLSALSRHVLVVGSSGSGKTGTIFSLLAGLWRDHRIPFLVMETVKSEYRALLGAPGMDQLQVVTIGRDDISPLRMNPLEPPAGVRSGKHQQSVLTSFKAALPLDVPLPMLLTEALGLCYARAGWDEQTTVADGVPAPTLRSLLLAFDQVFAEAGYRGEALNIAAAGRVRIASLLRGGLGSVFDTVTSSGLEQALAGPCIVELDELPDNDDKAVISAFLLDRVRAAARARRSTRSLAHVTVVEEAHRLFRRGKAGDAAGPRDNAVEAFCEAIAELRAYGEGFVLSTQRPDELADAAVANTATRLVHRLESAADRTRMLDDQDADDDLRVVSARLRTGEVIARRADEDEPGVVRVMPPPVGTDASMEDDEVTGRMTVRRNEVLTVRPFPRCGATMCPSGCSPAVRAQGGRITRLVEGEARRAWESEGWSAALDVVELVAGQSRDARVVSCAASQLDAWGAAFLPSPGEPAGESALVPYVRIVCGSER